MATAQKYSFKWRSWKPTFRGLNWKSSSINRCLQLSSVNRCVTELLLLCSLPPVRKFCWKTYHPHIPSWTFQSLGTCDWNLTGRWEHLDGLALWPVNESRFKTWYIYIYIYIIYIYICIYFLSRLIQFHKYNTSQSAAHFSGMGEFTFKSSVLAERQG